MALVQLVVGIAPLRSMFKRAHERGGKRACTARVHAFVLTATLSFALPGIGVCEVLYPSRPSPPPPQPSVPLPAAPPRPPFPPLDPGSRTLPRFRFEVELDVALQGSADLTLGDLLDVGKSVSLESATARFQFRTAIPSTSSSTALLGTLQANQTRLALALQNSLQFRYDHTRVIGGQEIILVLPAPLPPPNIPPSPPPVQCPCVASFGDSAGRNPDGSLEVSIFGIAYSYPPMYGLNHCSAFDQDLAPFCSDALEDWCVYQWCFVNASNCNVQASPSQYFPGLSFSYLACGSPADFVSFYRANQPQPPPTLPSPPSPPHVCEEVCGGQNAYVDDGECDDGGPGAEYSDCCFGCDCADCGVRLAPSPPPSLPQSPRSPPALPSPPSPPQPPSLPPPPSSPWSEADLSIGAMIGVAVGAVVCVGLVVAIAVWVHMRGRRRKQLTLTSRIAQGSSWAPLGEVAGVCFMTDVEGNWEYFERFVTQAAYPNCNPDRNPNPPRSPDPNPNPGLLPSRRR